jgi:hypothetical protein
MLIVMKDYIAKKRYIGIGKTNKGAIAYMSEARIIDPTLWVEVCWEKLNHDLF